MAAVTTVRRFVTATPGAGTPVQTGNTAGAGGTQQALYFSKDDAVQNATPTPIPIPVASQSPYVNYGMPAVLALNVDTAGGTISNRRLRTSIAPATGLGFSFKPETATYAQATLPAADTTSGHTAAANPPTGFTNLTTTDQVYDNTTSSAATGPNGFYVQVALAVDSSWATNGSVATLGTGSATLNVIVTYDES